MKKIYYFLFIFCLIVGFCLGFNTKPSKAAIIQPPLNNNIQYTQETFNNSVSEFALFNSYDYSFLKNINVDIHLTSTNLVSTSLLPTTKNITSVKFNNYSITKTMYGVDVYLNVRYNSNTYQYIGEIYQNVYNTHTYSVTTCTSQTYYSASYTTTNAPYKTTFLFETASLRTQAINKLQNAYSDGINLFYDDEGDTTSWNSNFNSFIGGTALFTTRTGLAVSSSSRTATCSSQTINACDNNFNSNFDVYLYDKLLGNFNINKPTTYTSGYSYCTISAIGTNINNGYYYSYTLDFKSLSLNEKINIWNSLTQRNQTNTFNFNTISIISDNDYFTNGITANIYLELEFNGSIYYEYNNLYLKFDSNNTNKLTYIYYGIFDLLVNYSTQDTYVNYVLTENSTINSDSFILINENNLNHQNNYLNLNFNIALLSEAFIDQQIGNANYNNCRWYQFMCHVENFFNKLIYDIPVLSDFYIIFNNVKTTISNVINLFIEYKEVTFIGSVVILSLMYHLIKRSIE